MNTDKQKSLYKVKKLPLEAIAEFWFPGFPHAASTTKAASEK